MSRELMKPLAVYTGIYSTPTFSNGILSTTGRNWLTDGNYIEINPSGNQFYYDIIYSNVSGTLLYIGFERYDAAKTPTSNNSCIYVLSSTSAATNTHICGTVNLATDVLGSPTKYIKLRILTDWNNDHASSVTSFKFVSLREASTITAPTFGKNGIVTIDAIRTNESALIYKNGIMEAADIIEN